MTEDSRDVEESKSRAQTNNRIYKKLKSLNLNFQFKHPDHCVY